MEKKNYELFKEREILVPSYDFFSIENIGEFSFYVACLENVRRKKNKFYNFRRIPPLNLARLIKRIHSFYENE